MKFKMYLLHIVAKIKKIMYKIIFCQAFYFFVSVINV